MIFDEIVKIFTFLLGTSLQISILFLMAKRKGQQGREIVLALFTFSVLTWSFGIFISLFSCYLYRGENIIQKIFKASALIGFTLIFPLLIHTLLFFLSDKYFRINKFIRYALYFSIYLPTIAFSDSLIDIVHNNKSFNTPDFISHFVQWAFALLIIAWYITIISCRKADEDEERRFLGIIGWMITGIIVIYCITYVLKAKDLPIIGSYIILISEILTFMLPPTIAYYIYRYNYIEYVLKRSLIYCFVGIVFNVFYLYVVRPTGESMEKRFQINFRMVEAIIMMLLVFFINPLSKFLQDLFNKIFFKEKQYYSEVISSISTTINQSTYMDLENLLDAIAQTLSRAMKIREISFVFFGRDEDKVIIKESTLAITANDIKFVLDYIEKNDTQVLNIYDLGEEDHEILREMKNIHAFTIISIYNEKKIIGILNIGKRRIKHRLLAEEVEMLIMLVNQMVISFHNTKLVREKFALERKMYENEKLSSLGRLSASIAHEVKNPLSSIKTITQVMLEEIPETDPNREGLTLILGEIDRLSRVVRKLLRFAKPHTSNLEEVDVLTVIRDVLLLLKHEANKSSVNIICSLDDDDTIGILSDRDALSEIFFNLIHNAIQALPEGGNVKIDKSVQYNEDNFPISMTIGISDNGDGIPSAHLEKIFKPFFTTKQTGTGLGLTIVKQRIDKLKGEIIVEDNNPGTRFEVTLPVAQIDKVKIPQRENRATGLYKNLLDFT